MPLAELAARLGEGGSPAIVDLRDADPSRAVHAAEAGVAHRGQRAHQHAGAQPQVLAKARQGHARVVGRRGQLAQDRGRQRVERRADRFKLVAYDIPRGNLAAYYPETNPLVPLSSTAIAAGTPTSKSIPVILTAHEAAGSAQRADSRFAGA